MWMCGKANLWKALQEHARSGFHYIVTTQVNIHQLQGTLDMLSPFLHLLFCEKHFHFPCFCPFYGVHAACCDNWIRTSWKAWKHETHRKSFFPDKRSLKQVENWHLHNYHAVFSNAQKRVTLLYCSKIISILLSFVSYSIGVRIKQKMPLKKCRKCLGHAPHAATYVLTCLWRNAEQERICAVCSKWPCMCTTMFRKDRVSIVSLTQNTPSNNWCRPMHSYTHASLALEHS